MKKRNKKLFWRILKKVIKFIWFIIKKSSIGLYYLFNSFYNLIRFLFKKIKQKNKERKLSNQSQYKIAPVYSELKVASPISGEYDNFQSQLMDSSLILLIFGKRGSGKSALGFRVLENISAKSKRSCFVIGVKSEVLPEWIKSVGSVDEVSNGGIVLVDEGAITFGSRESMSSKNRELGKLMAIARHKDLTLIFITQNTGMLDRNVIKLADVLLIKEGSLLQLEMERPEIKKFYEKADNAFKSLEGDKKKYAYIVSGDFEGVLEVSLPGFWSTSISKSKSQG